MIDVMMPDKLRSAPLTMPETDEEEERLVAEAVWDALRDHKQAGNPIAVWENGKVKIIPPEDIVLPEDLS